ncbi:MAG: hypothetical protein J5517_02090 [Eubacterium sp.]|nr:hypothetical protein [Eubacterium sp.]
MDKEKTTVNDKERFIDRLLSMKFNIKGISFEMIDILFVVILWLAALIIRIKLLPVQSADYYGFLYPWMEKIEELGGFSSMGTKISDYASSYMYLMCYVQSVTDDWLTGLKVVSYIFDFAASVAIFMIVYQLTKSTRKSIAAMTILLLSPAVIIDSAYYCQCDSIYTFFILLAIYFILKKNSRLCMIMIGVAFSFKFQTIFILPFIVILWLRKYVIKLIDFIWIPVIYVISIIPAWMFGRSLKDLLLIYFAQGNEYTWGTLNFPNFYSLMDEAMPNYHMGEVLSVPGILMTLMLLGLLAYYIYAKKVSFENNHELIIITAIFTVALTVYTLPHIHERYGFLIDILAIIYAIKRPRRIPLMCAFFTVTVIIYMIYLTGVYVFSMQTMTIVETVLIMILGIDLYKEINSISKSSS